MPEYLFWPTSPTSGFSNFFLKNYSMFTFTFFLLYSSIFLIQIQSKTIIWIWWKVQGFYLEFSAHFAQCKLNKFAIRMKKPLKYPSIALGRGG